MTPSAFVTVFLAALLWVGLKSFQQLSVVHHRIGMVWPVSLGMACTEFFVVVNIARGDPAIILPLWLGGALGCTASMVLHKRLRERS